MAAPLVLIFRRVRLTNLVKFSPCQQTITGNSVLISSRNPWQTLQISPKSTSNPSLEGMAEFDEEEPEWDLSPLKPPERRLPEQPWKQTRRWHAREYAKYGKASGVDPAIIWPTREELKALIAEEREYFPSLQEMQAEIETERKAVELERMKREKIIEANMAKMPKMIEDYRNKKRQEREKQKQQKAKRERLLAQAKEKLGYAIDPRSPRFKQMVEEMEAEEKKRRKELKRKGISV